MSNKAFIILGNQLFPKEHLKDHKEDHIFMAEDLGLCTYEKHHKQKILLFLSSMRSYSEELKKAKFNITYYDVLHSLFKKIMRKNYKTLLRRIRSQKLLALK